MTTIAFLDCETASLWSGPATIWELATIIRDEPGSAASDEESVWHIRPDLTRADAGALKVGGYYDRCQAMTDSIGHGRLVHDNQTEPDSEAVIDGSTLAHFIAEELSGAVLVGANVGSFDVPHLDGYLRAHGECLTADYHYLDVGSLVLGWAAGKSSGFRGACELLRGLHSKSCELPMPEPEKFPPLMAPLKLDAALRLCGLSPEDYQAHTALGDARAVRDIWDVVMGGAS